MSSNTVRINGKSFDIRLYDDSSSIVAMYSLREKGAVPGFFSIKTSESFMKKGLKLTVRDIREELNELSLADLQNPTVLYRLKVTFPRFSNISDLINLWLQGEYPSKKDLEEDLEDLIPVLRNLDPRFNSHGIILKNYVDFKARLKRIRKRTKKDLREWNQNMELLSEIPPTEALPFVVRRASISMNLQMKDVSILEVFDAFEVSSQIPLIALQVKGRVIYKVFSRFIPPEKWVTSDLIKDGLHFWILGGQSGEFYTGYLSEKHYMEFEYRLESGPSEDQIIELVLGSLGTRIGSIEVSQREEKAIGGSFEVKLSFNKAIMADLIALDDITSNVLLLKELSKSATEKKNFTFSYRLWNGKTVSAIITVHKKGRVYWTRITLRKASNLQEIKVMEYIFQRIATLYTKKKGGISRFYYQILPRGKELIAEYDSKEERVPTEPRKPGTRLSKLIQERPNLFIKGEYSTLCQKDRQPLLLKGKEELPKSLQKKKDRYLNFPPDSEDYYVCLENKSYPFPGLRLNKMHNKGEYPYIPCCFLKPRGEKNREILDIWDDKTALRIEALGIEPFTETVKGHVMNSEKLLSQGRFGRLPPHLQELAVTAGYNVKGEKRVLRLGVAESPSNFIHCLERALNPDYIEMSDDEREERVQDVRERISKYPNFAVGKQELFDHSDREIRRILKDAKLYLNPSLFVSLLSKYYQATIFLYTRSHKFSDGGILIPFHTQAYLFPEIDIERPTVLILENLRNGKIPQCELLVAGTKKIKVMTDFSGDVLANVARNVLYESNQVSAVKPEISRSHPVGLSPYTKISSESELLADSQFIDIYGKTRALNYGDVTLITSPLPPFDLPIKNPQIADEEDLNQFLRRAKFKIIFQDQGVIPGVWVQPLNSRDIYLGYVPVDLSKTIPGVPIAPETRVRPLSTEDPKYSALSQMRKSRKIAHLLQEYTLFEYSQTQSTDIFVVDPDHTFEPKEVYRLRKNNAMYQDGKLVVPSEDVAHRLTYYLKTQLLNDRQWVLSYGRNSFSQNAYTELSNYHHRRNQLVFLDSLGILKWRADIRGQLLSHVIQNRERPALISPYFYRNPHINGGKVILVQNVANGSFNGSISIGKRWAKDQSNLGYFTKGVEDNTPYFVYTGSPEGKATKEEVPILIYPNGDFAALLFF